MDYHENPVPIAKSDSHKPILIRGRMKGIKNSGGERVAKYGGRFLKRNTMFLQIRTGFHLVPFENQRHHKSSRATRFHNPSLNLLT